MIEVISRQEWQALPTHAQQEVRDFFLFIKAKYVNQQQVDTDRLDTMALSEQALAEDWLNPDEDQAWSKYQ
jgi:hypothetical protein